MRETLFYFFVFTLFITSDKNKDLSNNEMEIYTLLNEINENFNLKLINLQPNFIHSNIVLEELGKQNFENFENSQRFDGKFRLNQKYLKKSVTDKNSDIKTFISYPILSANKKECLLKVINKDNIIYHFEKRQDIWTCVNSYERFLIN